MSHLRVLPEQGETEIPEPHRESGDERPPITVTAVVNPEHDRDDVAELLRLAARSASVDLHLEFARTSEENVRSPGIAPVRESGQEPAQLWTVPESDARLRVLVPARVVLRDGVPVRLTRLEFDLLLFLAERPGRVFRREALLSAVWGADSVQGGDRSVTRRTVDVHIRRVRVKLGQDLDLISTVRGVGYRLDGASLTVEGASERAAGRPDRATVLA